jgi:ethanolamine utilization protein EutQ (cupin superfamily)
MRSWHLSATDGAAAERGSVAETVLAKLLCCRMSETVLAKLLCCRMSETVLAKLLCCRMSETVLAKLLCCRMSETVLAKLLCCRMSETVLAKLLCCRMSETVLAKLLCCRMSETVLAKLLCCRMSEHLLECLGQQRSYKQSNPRKNLQISSTPCSSCGPLPLCLNCTTCFCGAQWRCPGMPGLRNPCYTTSEGSFQAHCMHSKLHQ